MFNLRGVANYLLSAILPYTFKKEDDRKTILTRNSTISISSSVESNSITSQVIRADALNRFRTPSINTIANNIKYTDVEKAEILHRVNQQINLEDLTINGNDNNNETDENNSTHTDSASKNPSLESMDIEPPEQTNNTNVQNNIDYICGIPAEQWFIDRLSSAFDAKVESLIWDILQKVTANNYHILQKVTANNYQMQAFIHQFQLQMTANMQQVPYQMPAYNQPGQQNLFQQQQQPNNYQFQQFPPLQPQPNFFFPRNYGQQQQQQQQPQHPYHNANVNVGIPMPQQQFTGDRNQIPPQQQLDRDQINLNDNNLNQPAHPQEQDSTHNVNNGISKEPKYRFNLQLTKGLKNLIGLKNRVQTCPIDQPSNNTVAPPNNITTASKINERTITILKREEGKFAKSLQYRLKQHQNKFHYNQDYKRRIEPGDKFLGAGANGAVQNGVIKIGQDLKKIAIKTIDLHYGGLNSNVDNIEGTKHEAVITATSDHPNIVRAEAIFFKDNQVVLALELMHTSLHDLMKNVKSLGAKFSESHIVYIARKILNGLCYLEEKWGVLHGDLKGPNILIGLDGQVKLTDFGFARAHNVGIIETCGTAGYMAPELGDKNKLSDGKVDIWSLGITLIELLDLKSPIKLPSDDNFSKVCLQAANLQTPPLFERKDISTSLNFMLTRYIVRIDPKGRLSTRELIKAFDDEINLGLLKCCSPKEMADFVRTIDREMTSRNQSLIN